MECPKCRQVHPDDTYFCARCGGELPCPSPDSDPPVPGVPPYCPRCDPFLSGASGSPNSKAPERKRISRPLLWILGIVILIWLAIMAWYFLSEDKYLNMKFVIVPQGCFQMGSDEMLQESPKHEVCVDWFYMSQHEVTQSQWESVMGHNPSSLNSCGENCPVNGITWEQAQQFINKLNARGKERFRLPTEAEWEYACRAGARQRYCGGDDADLVAWHIGNARGDIHPVGQKSPNAFQLFDMSGNVWEWVSDRFDPQYYATSPKTNPKGPPNGSMRGFRGGSVKSSPEFTRPTQRNGGDPRTNFGDLGLRLVRIP
jgi:sulfatase modifying factor 1